MTDVEAPAHLADHEGPKKKKSDSLGIELLKSKCAPGGRPQKRTARSSTSPNPAPLIRQARKEKPHLSDDDDDDELDHREEVHHEEDDGGEEETSTVATSSSSSVTTTHTADDDEEEDEGEEIEEDEKEGRCYAFDMNAGAGEDEDEEEEGEVDEEDDDDDDDDDESESYDTTEGTENTFDNADDDEVEDDDDHPQTKAFETINAVTGVVGRPRGLAKLKLPLREVNDAASEPVSSPRGFSSPRAFYSPRPMMMPMTPHSKAAALSVTSRERPCDVELVVEEGQRMVAAGSIQGLVDKLVSIDEGIVDFDLNYYTSVFLITHPMFITTTELLQRLFDAAEAPAEPFPGGTDDPRVLQQRVRTRVLEVIKKWAEEFSSDFKAGCEAREHLDSWLAKQTKDDTGEDIDEANDQQSQLLKKIQALLSSNDLIQKHMVPIAPTPPPAAMAAHSNDPDKLAIPLPPPPPVDDLSRFCVLDFPPAKIAQQLTYIDFQMFSAVRFSEFFHCAWSKKDCELRAPNLVRLIDRFNRVSQWIQTSIVRVRDLKKRAAVLARFIHIAQEFEWLHNFQGMMMVNAALNNSAISRLKHTWAALGQEDKERFDSIQTFFSPYHNYASYRQKLRTSVPPIVPFMALFLTDLTFIDENEDKVARKKATSDAAGKEDTELDAKEAHDERTSAKEEEAHPHSDAADQPAESDVAAAASPAETSSIEAIEEEVKDLVNFQKMELVGKVLLNVKKFQKATYKNLIPSAPFQKFFGEITEVPMPAPEEIAREKKKEDLYAASCLMWSLDSIYKYSLVIEPRDGKPPKTKSAKPKKARASSTAPASLENSPVRAKKEPSRKASASSKKYATMGRSSKRASPDATLTIQQNPLLMQLQSRNLAQRRQSRSGSIDASSPIVAAVTTAAATSNVPQPPPAPVVVVNPLLAAAAAAKKERSYSMPPIILEKSASLSALRKYRDEKEEELAAANGDEGSEPPMLKKGGKKKSLTMMTLASSTPETPTPPSPLSAPMMVVSESSSKRRASATEKKEKKDKKDKKDKREKGSKLMGSTGGAPGELRHKKKSRDISKSNLLADL